MIYERCDKDNMKVGLATVGCHPETGEPLELNIHGAAAASAVMAAIMAVTAAIKTGVETDFIERMALAILPQMKTDPHALCPVIKLLSQILVMTVDVGKVAFTDEGRVLIVPADKNVTSSGFNDSECLLDGWNTDAEDTDTE